MNEIDIILKKNPSINKEDLLILASWLLEYCDNKCPKSIASFRENIDKWCEVTIPLEGIKIINGEILQEWSQEIPEEDGGPIIDDFPRI